MTARVAPRSAVYRLLMAEMRDGSTTEDERLGRLAEFDPNSRNYSVRRLLENEDTHRGLRAKYWYPGPVLDQQREGQCVAEGSHGRRNASPLKRRPLITDFSARHEFYIACQHRDPWPGCSQPGHCGPAYGGTSVLAGMQEGKDRGWWREYRWIGAGSGRLEDDVIDTLREVGGIVFGIPWLESMYETNPDGLVDASGAEVGGHCIHGFAWVPRLRLPKSFKGTKPAIALQNSWGPSWGVKKYGQYGIGYILLDDLMPLLENDRGEGAVPLA